MKSLKMLSFVVIMSGVSLIAQATHNDKNVVKHAFEKRLDSLVEKCDVLESSLFGSEFKLFLINAALMSPLTHSEQQELLIKHRTKYQSLDKLKQHSTCQKMVHQLNELEDMYKEIIDGGSGNQTPREYFRI